MSEREMARRLRRWKTLAIATGSAAAVFLVVGTMATWLAHRRAMAAEAAARQRADELKQVADFQGQMLAQIDPTEAGQQLGAELNAKFAAALERVNVPEAERDTRAEAFRSELHRVNQTDAARELIDRTVLQPAIAAVEKQLKGQPVTSQLHATIVEQYRELGFYDERALATERETPNNSGG